VRLETPFQSIMAATDLVPCYYTGQNYRSEIPAEVHPRAKVRDWKNRGLGKFIESGRIFLFAKRIAKVFCDGVLGVGNLLPFAKFRSSGDKLHYEMPMAGHKTPYQRSLRRLIHVSHRSYFSKQAIV